MNEILSRKFDIHKAIADYRKVAWFYDAWGKLTESKALRRVMEMAGIRDGLSVLEVGCGTGTLLREIIPQNPHGINKGFDLSGDMLKRAGEKLQKAGLQNFHLVEGDALNLRIEDNSVDILISTFMIDLLPEDTFDKIAKNFYRVLKPNGYVVIAHFSFGTKPIHKIWYWIAKRLPGLLTGCRPISFANYLEKAGFNILTDIQVSQNTFPSEIIKARK